MKYIIVLDKDDMEHFFMFPKHINHSDMFESMRTIKIETNIGGWYRNKFTVVSAGFVDLKNSVCYGNSETLGVGPRQEDSNFLK